MEYVTVKSWSWAKFKGEPGDKLTDDLPHDVIAALLRSGAIQPIEKPATV